MWFKDVKKSQHRNKRKERKEEEEKTQQLLTEIGLGWANTPTYGDDLDKFIEYQPGSIMCRIPPCGDWIRHRRKRLGLD